MASTQNEKRANKGPAVYFHKDKDGKPTRRWPNGRIRYYAKITWPNGRRQDVAVEEINCATKEIAEERVAEIQAEITATGSTRLARIAAAKAPQIDAAEMSKWFDAWESSRVAKGLTSTRDNRSHYEEHITKALGPKHVRDWTVDDMRALVRRLDERVQAGEIAWKTAVHVWTTTKKICADAISSKIDALRVRKDDPSANVEGPDHGEDKSKPFLYPSEFLTFYTCKDVPLRWRRAVALAIYLFPRDAELRVLNFDGGDLDLEHGTVHIHRAWDRRTKKIGSTKSGRSRRFNIEGALLPLLATMDAEADHRGPLVDLPSERDMARGLRRWLKKAGVTRRELHEDSRTTRKMRFHDLRATGLTWMAIRGDDPLKIMQRAGHTDFATTQLYVRTAEAIREGFGDVFPTLPAATIG